MRAGKLRHRLTFQVYVESQAVGGQAVKSWEDSATVWGSVSPLTAKELAVAEQISPRITHKISIRRRPPSLPANAARLRVLFGARIFHLASSLNWEERGIESSIMAEEQPGVSP